MDESVNVFMKKKIEGYAHWQINTIRHIVYRKVISSWRKFHPLHFPSFPYIVPLLEKRVNMLFRKKDELSDEEIMAGLRAEGNKAQRITNYLFDKYRGLVYKGINRYRLSEEDALDVYSDAIIAVGLQVRNGKFRGESKLSTYLFKIFYNRCINKVRDLKSKQLDLVEEMPDYPQAGQSILQAMITQEEVNKLISFLNQLGDRCKEIILMREYYGYTMDEIAEKIGFKTARSVSAMKARCRAKLKELIAKAKGIEGWGNDEIVSE